MGITLLRRGDHPWVEALEQAVGNARALCNAITSWENRWYQRNLIDEHPEGVSERAKAVVAQAEAMTPVEYQVRLVERQAAQLRHAAVAPLADAVDGMPVGVQAMGQRQQDARVTALARWLLANVPAVVVR